MASSTSSSGGGRGGLPGTLRCAVLPTTAAIFIAYVLFIFSFGGEDVVPVTSPRQASPDVFGGELEVGVAQIDTSPNNSLMAHTDPHPSPEERQSTDSELRLNELKEQVASLESRKDDLEKSLLAETEKNKRALSKLEILRIQWFNGSLPDTTQMEIEMETTTQLNRNTDEIGPIVSPKDDPLTLTGNQTQTTVRTEEGPERAGEGTKQNQCGSFEECQWEGYQRGLEMMEKAIEEERKKFEASATEEPFYYRCGSNLDLEAMFGDLSKGGSGLVLEELPMVTVTTAHRGERQLERNIWLNIRYAMYPPSKLELLIIDSSDEPSTYLQGLVGNHSTEETAGTEETFGGGIRGKNYPTVTYSHHPPPKEHGGMWIGNARNLMTRRAKGSIIISMDNDDIYPPDYIPYMVYRMLGGKAMTPVSYPYVGRKRKKLRDEVLPKNDKSAILTAGLMNRELIVHPDGSWTITGLKESAEIGGHHLAYLKGKNAGGKGGCRFTPVGSSEETGFYRCAENLGRLQRVYMPESAAMIKVQNPVSITNQLFYVNREYFTPLQKADWARFLHVSKEMYESIHAILRPQCILKDGYHTPELFPAKNITAEKLIKSSSESEETLPAQGDWKAWREHMKRNQEPCEGYSRLPGQQIRDKVAQRRTRHRTGAKVQRHVINLHKSEPQPIGYPWTDADIGEHKCCLACSEKRRCSIYDYSLKDGTCTLAFSSTDPPYTKWDIKGIDLTYLVSSALMTHSVGVKNGDNPRAAKKIKW